MDKGFTKEEIDIIAVVLAIRIDALKEMMREQPSDSNRNWIKSEIPLLESAYRKANR